MKIMLRILRVCTISMLGVVIILTGMIFINGSKTTKASERIRTPEIGTIQAKEVAETVEVPVYDIEYEIKENAEVETETEKESDVEETKQIVTVESVEKETLAVNETREEAETVVEEKNLKTTVVNREDKVEESEVFTTPTVGVALTDAQGKAFAKYNADKYNGLAVDVVEMINEHRTANGIEPVAVDKTLTLVAMHRAAENAWVECFTTTVTEGKLHHIRPNGMKASTIFSVYGLSGMYGENMGRYQMTPYEIVLGEYGWKNSKTHNELMLNNNYTKVGIGVAQDSYGDYYWTAIFSN